MVREEQKFNEISVLITFEPDGTLKGIYYNCQTREEQELLESKVRGMMENEKAEVERAE